MPWNPSKPAGSDPANTIDDSCAENFSALDTWASALTDGISAAAASVFRAYRAANVVIARFRAAAGDTFDRFRYDLNGRLEWGSGTAAPDIGLERVAANVLQLNGGDFLRVQQDPVHANDLARKSYVDTVPGAFGAQLLHVQDEKPAGTSGGNFESGAWRTRVLNTVKTNEIAGASLASNQITLPAGTYYLEASAPAYAVNGHQAKLRNVTDATDVLIGTSEYTPSTVPLVTRTFVRGRFTIAAEKTFELQHQCVSTHSSGFGHPTGFGVVVVYAVVVIWKIG